MASVPSRPTQIKSQNRRSTDRMNAYLSEGIRGRITVDRESIAVSLIDVSPFGIGIVPETDLSKKTLNELKPGSLVMFQYTSRHTSNAKLKAIVAHNTERTYQGEARLTLGLSFLSDESNTSRTLRRRNERFTCSEFFRPQAVCSSPYFFGEKAFLSLVEVSSAGFSALTSARNKFLMPGLNVQLTIIIPLIGNISTEATIRAVTSQDKESKYRVHFEFKAASEKLLAALGEYLVMIHHNVSITEIRKSGFKVPNLSNVLTIKNPAAKDDWNSILSLRQRMEALAGAPARQLEDQFDKFDSFSRTTMIQAGSRLVACGRIIFPNGEKNRSELAEILGSDLPEKVIATNSLEASYPIIDPDYHGPDAFDAIMKSYIKIAVDNDGENLFCIVPEHLANNFLVLGFKPVKTLLSVILRGRPTAATLFSLHIKPLRENMRPEGMTEERYKTIVLPALENSGIFRE